MASSPPLETTSSAQRWRILAVLCLGLLVVSIDHGILNVALPTLVRELGASPAELQWIVDAYVLVFAGLLLTAGNLGDRFGRKRVMTVGLVIFAGASVAAALADSPSQLVVWRAVLGIGAAMIMPATLAILVNVFTDPAERRKAIAYWSLMNAAGAFVGPVAGGLLLRHFSWGACFLVNIPFVVVALVLGQRLLPESRDPGAARFDVVGAVLSTGALAVLLWAIIEGPARGWGDPTVGAAFAVALALLVGFVAWELRADEPMIDLSTFREPQLTAAATAMTVAFMAMTGAMFLVSQSLQLVKGYSPLAAALATSGPIVAVNFLWMPRTPNLTQRVGARWMVSVGATSTAAACLVVASVDAASPYVVLFVGFALMAFGFSTFVPASTEAIMTAVPAEKAGGASAINQLTRQVGQALGVAIGGSIAASRYSATFVEDGIDLPDDVVSAARASITGALEVARSVTGPARDAVLDAARSAFMDGVRAASLASALVAILAAAFAAVAIPSGAGKASEDQDQRDALAVAEALAAAESTIGDVGMAASEGLAVAGWSPEEHAVEDGRSGAR